MKTLSSVAIGEFFETLLCSVTLRGLFVLDGVSCGLLDTLLGVVSVLCVCEYVCVLAECRKPSHNISERMTT